MGFCTPRRETKIRNRLFKTSLGLPRIRALQAAILLAIFLLSGSAFSLFVPHSNALLGDSSNTRPLISADPEQQINIFQNAPQISSAKSLTQQSPITTHFSSSGGATDPPSSWVSLGPQPIATNSSFTWGEPPFSGRVTAIAINGSNTQEIFVGAAQGGVWKSTDGGTTWTPLMDSEPNLAVGAIALSPDNKTIYVGTGEPNHCGDCYVGTGLLESSNGGNTWTVLGSSVFSESAISSILINSSNPSDLLVSTTWAECCMGLEGASNSAGLGIFQSKDGGTTWNLVLSPSSGNGVADLVSDPNNASVVYAGDFSGYVWQSTDGGSSWNYILYENSTANQGRVAVATSAALPKTIFAAFVNQTGALIGIYEHNLTSSVTTTLATPPSVVDNYGGSVAPCGSDEQCWYDLVLTINPTNGNDIYFGATSLYHSTDGGTTWTAIGGYSAGSIIHPDMHALVFMPGNSNTIFVGDDGGVSESTNQGASWTDLNGKLSITQFYYMAVSNSGKLILAGAQDNGCNEYNGSLAWNQVQTGDGGWVGFDPANSQIIYCVVDGNPWISTNGGITFQPATSGMSQGGSLDAPMGQDLNNSGTLYFGAYSIIYKTTNNMGSWTQVLNDSGSNIISIAVAPSNSNIIYAGDNHGKLFESTDGGAIWSTLGTIPYPVASIAVSPANASDVYVAGSLFQSPAVFEYLNGVEKAISSTGLPSSSVNVIKIYEGKIFAGLDSGGVYYLPLGASSWAQVSPGLTNAAVFDLAAINGTLYAATHGRGVCAINTTLVEQVALTLSFQIIDGGSGYSAPTLTYVKNGISTSATLSGTPTTFNVDYGTAWNISTVLLGSTSTQRWATSQNGGTISSGTTLVLSYYNQYMQTLSYSISDGGIPSAPTATGVQFGAAYSPALTTSPTGYWFDANGSITFTGSMNGGMGERWMTGASSISANSSGTAVASYYHQYDVPLSYSVLGGGSGYSAPSLIFNYLGSLSSLSLTETPTASWMDASSWSITTLLGGSNSLEQWETTTTSGTIASTNEITLTYNHQFYVSWAVSSSAGGTVTPAQSQWYNSGAVVQISASSFSGYDFTSWSSSTPLITFANVASSSTTATIDGSGTIQAEFSSSIGPVSSSMRTTTTTTSSSVNSALSTTGKGGEGGIPEFPFAITAIFTILIVASYLVIRRRHLP
ncbi:MAG: hypothetical protein PXY39_12185 [archaeon]|nr:hypothetical protein [archaeon]